MSVAVYGKSPYPPDPHQQYFPPPSSPARSVATASLDITPTDDAFRVAARCQAVSEITEQHSYPAGCGHVERRSTRNSSVGRKTSDTRTGSSIPCGRYGDKTFHG